MGFNFIFFLILSNSLVYANPLPLSIQRRYVPPTPSDTNGISALDASDLIKLIRFINYSGAAYCINTIADWKCGKYCDAIPGTVVTKTLSYQTPEMLTWLG